MCVIRYNISNNRCFVDINQNHSIEFQKKIVFLYPEEDSPPRGLATEYTAKKLRTVIANAFRFPALGAGKFLRTILSTGIWDHGLKGEITYDSIRERK